MTLCCFWLRHYWRSIAIVWLWHNLVTYCYFWFCHNLMTKCCFELWHHLVTCCYYWLWHHLLLSVGNVVGLNTTICPLLLQDLVEYLHVLKSTDTKKIFCDNRHGFVLLTKKNHSHCPDNECQRFKKSKRSRSLDG